jgi:DNA-binding Lrp family transcriptional regulator
MSQWLEERRGSEERYVPQKQEPILRSLSDPFSRMIILSTIERARSVEDLSSENNIPLSTCYRRVAELTRAGILVVERVIITPEGKKHILHRAAMKGVRIEFDLGHLEVLITPNEDVSEKLHSMWLSTRFHQIHDYSGV